VDTADFSNAGTSAVSIGSITATAPGAFEIAVTPITAGTLQLQVSAGASLTDVAGNPLDTSAAIADDAVITVNPSTTTVPNVLGMTQATAESTITGASLTVGDITQEYSTTVPLGDVISQGLTAGATVTEGSAVDLVVSLGIDATPKMVRVTVTDVSSTGWTTVDLGQTYNSLVVVATPIYPVGVTTPVVTRISNVTNSGFDVKLDRADGLNDAVAFDVSVIAVDEGVYTQATDGVTMEAVKYTSTVTAYKNTWVAESRSYQNTYTNPVVVGQVMSDNDSNWSVFWSMGASAGSPTDSANLNVGKHVGEDPNKTRADETIGYIVIESGTGTIDGIGYEAGIGADNVQGVTNSSTPYIYNLSGDLSNASAAAVSQTGMDGIDGSWAVLAGSPAFSTTTIGIYACEDRLSDAEQKHTTEQVAYLIFE